MIALFAALLAQASTPSPAPLQARTAQENFEQRCTICHGVDGKGKTKKGRQLKAADFASPKWQGNTTDQEIVEAITNGIPKHKMPAFKDKLTSEEIRALVPYLRTFGKK